MIGYRSLIIWELEMRVNVHKGGEESRRRRMYHIIFNLSPWIKEILIGLNKSQNSFSFLSKIMEVIGKLYLKCLATSREDKSGRNIWTIWIRSSKRRNGLMKKTKSSMSYFFNMAVNGLLSKSIFRIDRYLILNII